MSAAKILLVDDEAALRDLVEDVLQTNGYEVDGVGSLAEAKARLSLQVYDLVIADWWLPDGDGSIVADWASQLGAKTFVMSGHLALMPGGRALGHETIMKPFRPEDLVAAVRRSIGGTAANQWQDDDRLNANRG